MKYIIFNYHNLTVVETIETNNKDLAIKRLNKLNKSYNNDLIMNQVKEYNKLIKTIMNKLNNIKTILGK